MTPYTKYSYIYPHRPENKVSSDVLNIYDNGTFMGQPKLNGSNCLIFTNGVDFMKMNRHNGRITRFKIEDSELATIYRGEEWMILSGEYMNKSKKDEDGKTFNHKFVIFDILAYDGVYLVGKTFEERVDLLDEIYGKVEVRKPYLYGVSENVFRVRSYRDDFRTLYNYYSSIDMLEGLVMKRANAKLEAGSSENNNTRSQIKVRKPTKNYKY